MIAVTPVSNSYGTPYSQLPVMGRYSFSFLSDDNTQVGIFTKCREVIADTFMRSFNWAAFCKKPSLEKTRILVAYTDAPELGQWLKQSVDWLNQLETKLGLIPSTMDQVVGLPENLGTVYLVEGSKRWQLAPPMFSLFLLILRNGLLHTIGAPCTEAIATVECRAEVVTLLDHLLTNKYWKVFGKDQTLNWEHLSDPLRAGTVPYLGVFNFVEGSPSGLLSSDMKEIYKKIYPHWLFVNQPIITEEAA